MGFRNPLTSLSADKISSGTFSGTYINAGAFTLAGTPAGSHVQASATDLAFYAADGVTKLIDMDTAGGAGSINSATITGGLIRTAASGQRWELATATKDTLTGFTGDASEFIPGQLAIGAAGAGRYLSGVGAELPPKGLVTSLSAPFIFTGGLGTFPPTIALTSFDPANPSTSVPGIFFIADHGGAHGSVGLSRGNGFGEAWARDDLIIASFSVVVSATAGISTVAFPALVPLPLPSAPAVFVQMSTGASQWVVGATTTTNFTLRTWSATGVATSSGSTITGWFIAALP